MEKIILIGGGGHAKVLIDLIRTSGQFEIAGILDPLLEIKSAFLGIPVIGSDDMLEELFSTGIRNACIAVGSIRDNSKRKTLYEQVKKIGFVAPHLIHPKTIVSRKAQIADAVQIMAGAIIQAESIIGENTIVNTGSIIEHDCKIGKHVHVCPGVVISGDCVIGDGAFIGAGSVVIQGLKIGENSIVGAGAVVVSDVADSKVVMGVPAKEWMSRRVNG